MVNKRIFLIKKELINKLIGLIDSQTYYLCNKDYENYEQKKEEIIVVVDSLLKLIQPKEKYAETISSYFE